MKPVLSIRRPAGRAAVILALLAGSAAWSGGEALRTPGDTPAAVQSDGGRPIPPGHSELAASAFKKLDAGGKGYLTLDDVSGLPGFELVFKVADVDGDGRLSPAEFKKAWAAYNAGEKGMRG